MPIFTITRAQLIVDILQGISDPQNKRDKEKFLEIVKLATDCVDVRPEPGRYGKFLITYRNEDGT